MLRDNGLYLLHDAIPGKLMALSKFLMTVLPFLFPNGIELYPTFALVIFLVTRKIAVLIWVRSLDQGLGFFQEEVFALAARRCHFHDWSVGRTSTPPLLHRNANAG